MKYMGKWLRTLFMIMNVLSAAGLIISAYAGMVNPGAAPVAGLAAMTFVIWVCLSLLLLIADLFLFRKQCFIQVVALLACCGPLHTYCPLNLPPGELTGPDKKNSFTVLNYNVEGLCDVASDRNGGYNRTLHYILESGADMACLQECYEFRPLERYGVQQSQIDSMITKYPYYEVNDMGQAIFSKYPFVKIALPVTSFDEGKGDFEAYTIAIDSRTITLFNVHLQSIALTPDDRQLYMSLTRKPSEERLKQAKSQLLSKLCYGFKQRTVQAHILKEYIDTIGGNMIVCGDFNDVPGCYAIRTLEKTGLRDSYADAAFGPSITYHANRFYFRIDHSLYRGNFEAVKCERGYVDSSDHYPLITTYLWK